MNFSQSVVKCLSDYATFSGRSSRSEFWWFYLFTILVTIVCGAIDVMAFGMEPHDPTPFGSIASIVLFLPSVSATVRRLHDIERSGWWFWLFLLPIIGWIILLVWHCTRGKHGANAYGPDPLTTTYNQHAQKPETKETERAFTPREQARKSEYTTPPTIKRR